ncbi:MFS transporter [Kineococcus arenarius]|uniref:MFS transporter n=1 Tax=Kineococcus sp. SYSU DK007 TaxID=3383128 RepID=UPI003D7ECC78
MPLLLAALFVTGLFISPNLIAAQHLVDDLVPVHRMGEAQAWLSTAITAGAAVGNAVAGAVLEHRTAQLSLATAAGAVLTAGLVALLAQRRWRGVAALPA